MLEKESSDRELILLLLRSLQRKKVNSTLIHTHTSTHTHTLTYYTARVTLDTHIVHIYTQPELKTHTVV